MRRMHRMEQRTYEGQHQQPQKERLREAGGRAAFVGGRSVWGTPVPLSGPPFPPHTALPPPAGLSPAAAALLLQSIRRDAPGFLVRWENAEYRNGSRERSPGGAGKGSGNAGNDGPSAE